MASRTLAQNYSDEELIYSGMFSDMATVCNQGPYEDFNNSSLSGKMQTWYNRRGLGITNSVVAAHPEGRECVVVLQARIIEEADREAVQHMLDTVDADCGTIAKAKTEERSAEFVRVDESVPSRQRDSSLARLAA